MDYFIFFEDGVKVFESRGRWDEVVQEGLECGKLKPKVKYNVEKYQLCMDDYFERTFPSGGLYDL